MTDGNDAVSYGLNGERLVYNISRFHDANINASCLKIAIKHPGRRKALIRTISIITTVFIALYFLSELFSVTKFSVIAVIVTSANLIALWYAIVAGSEGSVVAVPSVGIQITTTYACGYTQSQFYPWRIVTNVIINETFTMYRVVFYLAILLGDDSSSTAQPVRIIPVFTEFSPRLPLIREMYCNMKELLFPKSTEQYKQM